MAFFLLGSIADCNSVSICHSFNWLRIILRKVKFGGSGFTSPVNSGFSLRGCWPEGR